MRITQQEDYKMEQLETLADIAYLAGISRYYGGDSRQDIQDFISWSREFEELHKGEPWIDLEYLDEIEAFAMAKMKSGIGSIPEPTK